MTASWYSPNRKPRWHSSSGSNRRFGKPKTWSPSVTWIRRPSDFHWCHQSSWSTWIVSISEALDTEEFYLTDSSATFGPSIWTFISRTFGNQATRTAGRGSFWKATSTRLKKTTMFTPWLMTWRALSKNFRLLSETFSMLDMLAIQLSNQDTWTMPSKLPAYSSTTTSDIDTTRMPLQSVEGSLMYGHKAELHNWSR